VIKRLSLLLAAMFVVSMMFVAPVFASGNDGNDDWNNGDDNACAVHHNNGDDDGKAGAPPSSRTSGNSPSRNSLINRSGAPKADIESRSEGQRRHNIDVLSCRDERSGCFRLFIRQFL
jgi:hypothetical protein